MRIIIELDRNKAGDRRIVIDENGNALAQVRVGCFPWNLADESEVSELEFCRACDQAGDLLAKLNQTV